MGRIEEKKKEKDKGKKDVRKEKLKTYLAVTLMSVTVFVVFYFLLFSGGTTSDLDIYQEDLRVIEDMKHPNLISQNASPEDTVKVYYYGDMQCPHCHSFEQNHLNDVLKEKVSTGEAMLIYKNLPVVNEASEINGVVLYSYWNNNPENYWDVHQTLNNNYRSARSYERIINILGENNHRTGFLNTQNVNQYSAVLQQNTDDANEVGVQGTPTFVIKNNTYQVATSEELIQAIDEQS